MGREAFGHLLQPPGLPHLRILRPAVLPPVLWRQGRGAAGGGQGHEAHLPGPWHVVYSARPLGPSQPARATY
eukprot:15269061-Alexandrium_andersonii.AAC.1